MRLTELYSSGLLLVPFYQIMSLEGQNFCLTDLNVFEQTEELYLFQNQ